MRKQWYKVTFYARMSQDDLHAMSKYLYDTMNESMEIEECEGLRIEEDEPSDYEEPHYDLSLYDDEYQLDMRTGDIFIPYDCYPNLQDSYKVKDIIDIKFMDEEDELINRYVVKEFTEEGMKLSFIGN